MKQYLFLLCLAAVLTASCAQSEVRLPALLSDGLVLQREKPVRIWGWAAPGENVTVTFATQQKSGQADLQGRWEVKLNPMTAGGPYEMLIAGTNTLTVDNILVGEVWFAAGQSNMEMTMGWSPSKRNSEEIAKADWPQIREFTVQPGSDIMTHNDAPGSWITCSPNTVANFSAAAYFFARELHQQLQVPVGIIRGTWGGTGIESWISRDAMLSEPVLKGALDSYDRDAATVRRTPRELKLDDSDWMKPEYDDSTWQNITLPLFWDYALYPIEYNEGIIWARRTVVIPETWSEKRVKIALAVDDYETTYFNGQQVGHSSTFSQQTRTYEIPAELVKAGKASIAVRAIKGGWGGIIGEEDKMQLTLADDPTQRLPLAGVWKYKPAELGKSVVSPRMPTVLYNAIVNPFIPCTIRGAIWYQGEANAYESTAFNYRQMLATLIRNWRSKWGEGNFPFYFVQLPNFRAQSDDPNQDGFWAVLRESQAATLAVPNTGMAVTIDIGEADNIHPGDKWDVGKRLALLALEKTYRQKIHGQSPLFEGMKVEGNKIRVEFKNANGGLVTKDNTPVKGFVIAGADGKFVWADAVIDGSTVIVSSDKVQHPVAVRYAWGENPVCNLYNKENLPAGPFRAGQPGK